MPYPAPLGHRLGYDRDGTVVLIRERAELGGSWREMNPEAVRAMNSTVLGGARAKSIRVSTPGSGLPINTDPTIPWSTSATHGGEDVRSVPNQWGMLFPELMQLSGIYYTAVFGAYNQFSTGAHLTVGSSLQVSSDTTNLIDGTWRTIPTVLRSVVASIYGTLANGFLAPFSRQDSIDVLTGEVVAPIASALSPFGYYRKHFSDSGEGQQTLSLRNIKGIKFTDSGFSRDDDAGEFKIHTHLYGAPETATQARILALWSATQDAQMVPGTLSWGDHPQSSSADRAFRIKNISSGNSATAIEIRTEDEFGYGNPLPSQQFLFSLDGLTWSATVVIGSLSPGALSPVIRARRNTPATALVGPWSPRITFEVGSWT